LYILDQHWNVTDIANYCEILQYKHFSAWTYHVLVPYHVLLSETYKNKNANDVVLCRFHVLVWRTLPAGYLEMGESAREGAIRETREEANAEVEVISPFAQLDIPLIGQVTKNQHLFIISLLLLDLLM